MFRGSLNALWRHGWLGIVRTFSTTESGLSGHGLDRQGIASTTSTRLDMRSLCHSAGSHSVNTRFACGIVLMADCAKLEGGR